MANTYNADLSNNNALLQTILSIINNLPEHEEVEIVLQSKTVSPSTVTQTIVPDSGYTGLNSVVINGDSNLISSNIKNGVSIFGITGTYVPVFA